ncbi:MAG: prefoldin subunit [Candidatus Micrarchaeota archaeon]|nr:prefoldin subunit [Candidatus Micrarchaeota archaeon]
MVSQQDIEEFNALQSQLQVMVMQHQQIRLQIEELNEAVSEIDKTKDDIFHLVGTVFIKAEKEETKKALDERRQLLVVREATVSKQEERLRGRLEEIRKGLEAEQEKDEGAG